MLAFASGLFGAPRITRLPGPISLRWTAGPGELEPPSVRRKLNTSFKPEKLFMLDTASG
jgi:hypothetical protein